MDSPNEKAGRSVAEFAEAVGLGRASIYILPPEQAPESIKIGKRRIIIEQPRAWLERIAAQQKAEGGGE